MNLVSDNFLQRTNKPIFTRKKQNKIKLQPMKYLTGKSFRNSVQDSQQELEDRRFKPGIFVFMSDPYLWLQQLVLEKKK